MTKNKITGKIILKETGVGIANLLITIYDLDPGTKPEELIQTGGDGTTINNPTQQIPGDRIGSVLTNESGEFELSLEDAEFRIRNEQEKRPDYLMLVLAPEELGRDLISRILYASVSMIRQNAGRIENYIIRLTEEQLEKAEIEIPTEPSIDPKNIINKFEEFDKGQVEIDLGIKSHQKKKLADYETRITEFDEKIKPELVKALSFTHGRTQLTSDGTEATEDGARETKNFVLPGQSVKKATEKVINETIEKKFNNRSSLTGFIGVTEEKIDKLRELQEDDSGDFFEVSEEEFNTIFFKEDANGDEETEETRSIILLKDDPIAKLCREKTLGEICLEKDDDTDSDGDTGTDGDGDSGNENGDTGGDGVEQVTGEDIPRFIASLVNTMTSPEERVSFGVTNESKRANQNDIQNNVDAFQLKAGPADTVSFHDFHNLQLAFEHVWEEAIDEGILELAKDAYKEIVELGGDPNNENTPVTPGYMISYVTSFQNQMSNIKFAYSSEPPESVVKAFEISRKQWNVLNLSLRKELESISGKIIGKSGHVFGSVGFFSKDFRAQLRQQGYRILKYADKLLRTKDNPFDRLHRILQELKKRLKEDYPFTVYAANRQERSINFGILVTYRQKWEPVSYQAGELSHTETLAPKEVRKFSRKIVVRRKRSEKEVDKSIFSKKNESAKTSRVEAEIIDKAISKSNFSVTANGSVDIPILGSTTHTTKFGKDADKASNEVKKDFREAVFKAAEEYKQERTIEVTTEETFEEEFTESGEIMNPNDELPVTFLFYELQRRYRVTEQIHRLTPVVLVAQEMPKPHEIDEDWIIAHDWILRRVLLDDSYLPALDYLRTRVVGDEFALEEMRKNVEQQRKVVEELREELVVTRAQVSRRRIALERAIEQRAGIVGGEEGLREDVERLGQAVATGGLSEVGRFFGLGRDQDEENESEAARIRQDAAREAFDRTLNEERKALARLEREVTALNEITESYTKLLSDHLNQRNQILRLRLHIKQNIFYYMQAIWSHEPPDQRFFRLHKVQVPTLKGKRTYKINGSPVKENDLHRLPEQGVKTHSFKVSTNIETNDGEFETVDLVEVADLDNLLGFKGNYMMFPLLQSNALTDFMMQPYVDNAFGDFMSLHDPDEFGNLSLDDFSRYVCCLKKKKPEEFEELKDELKETFEKLIISPLRNREEIIVPTGSLFIEALPGSHAILEDFKLMHRAIDVKKVQAEVREMELENIRAAARLLAAKDDTKFLDDPDVESIKQVFVNGNEVQPNIDVGNDS